VRSGTRCRRSASTARTGRPSGRTLPKSSSERRRCRRRRWPTPMPASPPVGRSARPTPSPRSIKAARCSGSRRRHAGKSRQPGTCRRRRSTWSTT
jgi:hypothetical protein